MKVCEKCGHVDNPLWRHSRFDYNADYMRWEDFQHEYPLLANSLKDKRNNEPIDCGEYYFYRRGTGGIEVYRVWKPDYKMPRERKNHGKRLCLAEESCK